MPIVARFSLAGGNPKAPDTAKSARGMALQFMLPGGQLHQMAMLNTPLFGAATPQTFLDLMQALQPDPATGKPDPEKMAAFNATHPDNLAQAQYLAQHKPPVSYANSAYWGIHTFKFIGKKNHQSLVRGRFLPQDGEQALSDEALKVAKNYFQAGRRRFNSVTEAHGAINQQKGRHAVVACGCLATINDESFSSRV